MDVGMIAGFHFGTVWQGCGAMDSHCLGGTYRKWEGRAPARPGALSAWCEKYPRRGRRGYFACRTVRDLFRTNQAIAFGWALRLSHTTKPFSVSFVVKTLPPCLLFTTENTETAFGRHGRDWEKCVPHDSIV